MNYICIVFVMLISWFINSQHAFHFCKYLSPAPSKSVLRATTRLIRLIPRFVLILL